MGETITTGDGLRVLRGPETLLDDRAGRLSHGGLLDTPAGLVTVLVLERRPVAPPAGAAPAWLVHLARPGRRDATLAFPTVLADTDHGVQIVVCVFGRASGHDRTVMAVHHPDLPRPASLFLDAPASPSPYATWVVEPALLAPPTLRAPRIWHTGLLRAGPVLFTHLEATADEPRLLDPPEWVVRPGRARLPPPRPAALPRPPRARARRSRSGGSRWAGLVLPGPMPSRPAPPLAGAAARLPPRSRPWPSLRPPCRMTPTEFTRCRLRPGRVRGRRRTGRSAGCCRGLAFRRAGQRTGVVRAADGTWWPWWGQAPSGSVWSMLW